MTGTIFVGPGITLSVRTVDFEWIIDELRSRMTEANRSALCAALHAHDEQGMDMLVADELDAQAFCQLAREFDDLTSALRSARGECRLLDFLEAVRRAIRKDPRWLAA